jgi:hypothetical protein
LQPDSRIEPKLRQFVDISDAKSQQPLRFHHIARVAELAHCLQS